MMIEGEELEGDRPEGDRLEPVHDARDRRRERGVSPVWYVPAGYRQFFSVSSPDAKHSRNLAVRPQVAMVIFDSHRPGGWQAVYMTAVGQRVAHADVDEGVAVFTGRSEEQGPPPWTRGDVQAPAPHRLYRAIVSEHCVLDEHDRRRPVALG